MAHKPGHFGPTEWADIDMSNYPSTYPAASVGTNPTNYNFGNINPDTQMQFSGRKAGWLNNMNTNTDSYRNMYGGGSSGILGKYTPDFMADWTGDGMKGVGSLIGGLGGLAQGWASLKNARLARDAYDTQKDQWQQNYESQRTAVNNQIANQNAWKQAQGRQDYGSYVGGKPSGTNYVG